MSSVAPPSWREATHQEMADPEFREFASLRLQPKWDVPETIAIHVAASARTAEQDLDYPATIDEYVSALTDLIGRGACGIHLDYGMVADKDGRRLDLEMPSVEAYGTILEPLRERFGNGFVSDVNTFVGDTFEECLAPAVAGLGETAPFQAGGPPAFVIPAVERLNELGVRAGIGVHSTGEIELAKRRFIDTGILAKPYHWWILYGAPFDSGRTLRSGTWVRNVQDAAQHLFLMTEQIKSLDEDSAIVVCAAGRATVYLTTLATMLGLHVRIGTEDTIWRAPNRDETYAGNLEMLNQVIDIAHHLGREPASADEWRQLVGARASVPASSS